MLWLVALLALWVGLSALTPDAAFLAFPLFFLELHVLAAPIAVPLVVVTFGLSVWGTATHLGFEVGSILGPLISAGVAIVLGLGYRAMVAGDPRASGADPRPRRDARRARDGEP